MWINVRASRGCLYIRTCECGGGGRAHFETWTNRNGSGNLDTYWSISSFFGSQLEMSENVSFTKTFYG